MKSNVLADVLVGEGGCQRDGDALLVPSGTRASVFVAVGADSLVIESVRKVSLAPDYFVAMTTKGERYAVAFEDVRALRFSSPGGRAGYAAD